MWFELLVREIKNIVKEDNVVECKEVWRQRRTVFSGSRRDALGESSGNPHEGTTSEAPRTAFCY